MEVTKQQKLEFIKLQNIPYIESLEYSVDSVYTFALVKDLISKRLIDSIECFGFVDKADETCKKCMLFKNSNCEKFAAYKNFLDNYYKKDSLVMVKVGTGTTKMEDIEVLLSKVNLRPSSAQYKIARLVLEANNTPYGELINKVLEICGPEKDIQYAKTRFYQVRKLIEERTDIKVEVFVRKYVSIHKVPKVEVKDEHN